MLSLNLTGNSVTYQIDLTLASDRTELLLKTVSAEGVGTEIDRATSSNGVAQSIVFTTACLGGSLLEVKNYEGRMQRALFNYNSLLEERNSCLLDARCEEHSNTVSFTSIKSPRSFVIKKYTLRAARIAFQVRFPSDLNDNGPLLVVNNSDFEFALAAINENGVVVFQGKSPPPLLFEFYNCFTGLTDGEWHQLEFTYANNSQLVIRYDNNMECLLNQPLTARELPTILDQPLHFVPINGPLTTSFFSGCMRAFEFQETLESEIFRPNLDQLARLNPDGHNGVDRCFNCMSKAATPCLTDQICSDPGFNESAECNSQEYSGPICQGESIITCVF